MGRSVGAKFGVPSALAGGALGVFDSLEPDCL
jgi:hypothetical protein